jgi:cellobiose-specific phosphotransferase system component IIC
MSKEYYERTIHLKIPKPKRLLKILEKCLRILWKWSPIIVFILWFFWGFFNTYTDQDYIRSSQSPLSQYLMNVLWICIGLFLSFMFWFFGFVKRSFKKRGEKEK